MNAGRTVLDYAMAYHRRGYAVVPVPHKSKRPVIPGWQRITLTEDDLPQHFGSNTNIGILTGKPSGWLVDVDCDAPEAVHVAIEFLPRTPMVHGHGGVMNARSKPRSHFWYRSQVGTKKYQFVEADEKAATMLVELRSTGCQTIVPPSVHTSGETIIWDRIWTAEGEQPDPTPADVPVSDLERAVAKVAASALIARHWPGLGSRDVAAMALCGMLARAGWADGEIDHFVGVTAEAAGDEQWRDRRKARQSRQHLDEGRNVTGAPRLATLLRDGERVVTTVREWLGLKQQDAPPQAAEDGEAALAAFPDWPEPMAEAAYIGPIGAFVKKLAPETEAAPEALLVQALAAFGNAIGRHSYFEVEATEHHANLSVVVVGGTGARKGVSWGHVRRYIRRADSAWEQDHIVNGLSSGEGLINVVRDEEPIIPDKVALAFESEFAAVFKVKGREGNTLSTVLRQAWDGEMLRSLTKNSPLKATGAHISIVGHITPDELRRVMTETDANNGFANRVLWVCAKRAQYLPHGGKDVNISDEVTQLRGALDYGKKAGRLKRDAAADALWDTRYRELSGGRPGKLGAVTNRAEAQVLRLQLIYALLDRSPVITERHLRAALAVWDYCLASAKFLFGAAIGDALAEKLDAELAKHGAEGMSRTEIYNFLSNHHTAREIAGALGMLASQGRAEMRPAMGDAGRTTKRWYSVAYSVNSVNSGFRQVEAPAQDTLNPLFTPYAPVCIKCKAPKRMLPGGGYELTCTCGQKVPVPA